MKKSNKNKELILEQLKKTPIIEVVCGKVGISRASLYRWKAEDAEFAKAVEKAVDEGTLVVNDAAESQIISGIKNGNLTASIFWLKNKHSDYRQKVFQSGLSVLQDADDNVFLEIFGELKPETVKLVEPYLNKPNPNDHE